MKQYFLVFFAMFCLLTLLGFVGIQFDLFLNPWLHHAIQEWKWYNYFTSHHSITALYLLDGWFWLIPPLVVSAVTSFALARD